MTLPAFLPSEPPLLIIEIQCEDTKKVANRKFLPATFMLFILCLPVYPVERLADDVQSLSGGFPVREKTPP